MDLLIKPLAVGLQGLTVFGDRANDVLWGTVRDMSLDFEHRTNLGVGLVCIKSIPVHDDFDFFSRRGAGRTKPTECAKSCSET